MQDIRLSWSAFKAKVDAGNLHIIEFKAYDGGYDLVVSDGPLLYRCNVDEADNSGANNVDYETNYRPFLKPTSRLYDSDGAEIVKNKTTKTGWHYEPRALDFFTARRGSLYNRKDNGGAIDDGTDYGDATIKFYDASNNELIQGSDSNAVYQSSLTSTCVKTVVDWQADYDFDIIGGNLQIRDRPASRAYIWSIVAPDIPESFGGSVPYFAGGFNLNFFYGGQFQNFNGRGVKSFKADPIYNSNKIRFIVKHDLGEQIGVQIILDQFKA